MTPRYVETYESGEFPQKTKKAIKLLENPCRVCPRYCKVDRLKDQKGVCLTGRYASVSSYFPHFGEEDCLRGWKGSGTIFFTNCNLKCVFCQNFETSQKGIGRIVDPKALARIMIDLQEDGCHNINFVTPEHVVPQIIESLPYAIESGLRLPLVYNTSGFDSPESLEILDGIVDIYMPDFKFWNTETARKYIKAANYPEAARHSIREMHRQVGDLEFDDHGLALKGVLVRHLVMPGDLAGTREVARFLACEVSPTTFTHLMDQYYPVWKANQYPEIDRPIYPEEYKEAVYVAQEEGLLRILSDQYF